MPYYEQIQTDPARNFEIRAQEYERKIERAVSDNGQKLKLLAKCLSALREAHRLLASFPRVSVQVKAIVGEPIRTEVPQWDETVLSQVSPIQRILKDLIQEIETKGLQ